MIGVITFPGSNGDHDALHSVQDDIGVPARLIDYRETDLSGIDALILPGGFAYGDALRCGAIARFSPVMDSVKAFAAKGGPVLGICNGFQVLAEAHLLPGALLRNSTLQFQSKWVNVKIEKSDTAWTELCSVGDVLRLPIANGEGQYFADAETLARIEGSGQVIARYSSADGVVSPDANSNGSVNNIAGITNTGGNVVGLMPHPERATNTLTGGDDGLKMMKSVLNFLSVPA
ncbi:MAG: phosphoribosylformylglycinamidine synthase subunit PurQ [Thermomicrobiales bacterium]